MTTNTSLFYPAFSYIIDITLGQFTIVTFSANHNFTPGQIVGFRVSQPYGTRELDNQEALVVATTNTAITVPIDSSNYTPFIFPVPGFNTPPVVVPSASGILPGSNPATVTLFDAFDNIPGA